MFPVLFEVLGVPIRSYGLMLAVAFLVTLAIGRREIVRAGLPASLAQDLALLVFAAGIVGARLLFVLLEWEYYAAHPLEVFYLQQGGLSFHGGVLGGVVAGVVFVRRRGLSAWRMADLAAPLIPLGTAIARVGCFLRGCCYGVPTESWLGLVGASYLQDVARHPTQLYAVLMNLALFAYLWAIRRRPHFSGSLILSYAFWYSAGRALIEVFRESEVLVGHLKVAQGASLLVILIAAGLAWIRARNPKEGSSSGYGSNSR